MPTAISMTALSALRPGRWVFVLLCQLLYSFSAKPPHFFVRTRPCCEMSPVLANHYIACFFGTHVCLRLYTRIYPLQANVSSLLRPPRVAARTLIKTCAPSFTAMKSQISDSLGADISFRACAKVICSDLTHFTQITSTIARASGERRGKISSIFDKASMGATGQSRFRLASLTTGIQGDASIA